MIKRLISSILLLFLFKGGFPQDNKRIDSLRRQLTLAMNDTNRVFIFAALCDHLGNSNYDSARTCGEEALKLAREINFKRGESVSLSNLGRLYRISGEVSKAMQMLYNALEIAEGNRLPREATLSLIYLGLLNMDIQNYRKGKEYFLKAQEILKLQNQSFDALRFNLDLATHIAYRNLGLMDSAIFFIKRAGEKLNLRRSFPDDLTYYYNENAYLQIKLGDNDSALKSARMGYSLAQANRSHRRIATSSIILARIFNQIQLADSCIHYAELALSEAEQIGFKPMQSESSQLLAEQYENKDLSKSHFYLKKAQKANDEIYGKSKVLGLQQIILSEQERHAAQEALRVALKNKQKQLALLSGLGIFLVLAIVFYRNYQQKQAANIKLEKTLISLQSTQAQLIQSEKMASLGELTAGIAHEIQNPLNFVNNFADVTNELISEMVDKVDKGNSEEIKSIAQDVQQNLEKIVHHGKRADSIVKGMLQHSRSTSGVKEPTDINALCDEYLRLSYHGLRARDQSFTATTKSEFDKSLGPVNIIPQEIGRVILNLLTNAFYAVNERKKLNEAGYEPIVTISTRNKPGMLEIAVKDNGMGINRHVLEKIFQPFFTTKPTGQGTGLGLSLAYDIITKGHGGELKVETKEGEGSEFIIQLPVV